MSEKKPLKLARSKAELWRTAMATVSALCSFGTLLIVGVLR